MGAGVCVCVCVCVTWDSGSPSSAALRYQPALRMMERAKLRCSDGRNIHATPHIRPALANLAPHNVDLPAAAMWSSSMPAQPPITSASPITWKPYLRVDEATRQRDGHSASDSGTSQATCCLHRSSALQGLLLRKGNTISIYKGEWNKRTRKSRWKRLQPFSTSCSAPDP
jgi:hypothetical protein